MALKETLAAGMMLMSVAASAEPMRERQSFEQMVASGRDDVLNAAPNEQMSLGYVTQGGGYAVAYTQYGRGEHVSINLPEALDAAVWYSRGDIARICIVHTHPLNEEEAEGDVLPHAPPSWEDTDPGTYAMQRYHGMEMGITAPQVNAVLDARGVWYSKMVDEKERAKLLPPEWRAARERLRDTDARYAAMAEARLAGYTRKEMEELFLPHLPKEEREQYADRKELDYPEEMLINILRSQTGIALIRGNDALAAKVFTEGAELALYAEYRAQVTDAHRVDMAARERAMRGVVEASRVGTPTAEQYRALRDAYLEYSSTLVRFVPYEQMRDEPPCAGARRGQESGRQ